MVAFGEVGRRSGSYGVEPCRGDEVTVPLVQVRRDRGVAGQGGVELMLSRREMYYGTGYRPHTVQHLALGAGRDGRLAAIVHDAYQETPTYEEYAELDDPTTERYLPQLAYYQGGSFPCLLGSGRAADRALA